MLYMKLPVVTKCWYLLFTVLCDSSYGDTSDKCTGTTYITSVIIIFPYCVDCSSGWVSVDFEPLLNLAQWQSIFLLLLDC